MGAFTREQATLLASLLEAIIAGLTKTNVRLAALQKLLIAKGSVTSEELQAALKEAEAGMAVEKALRPELDAITENLERLLEGSK